MSQLKNCVIFATWAPYRNRIRPYIDIIKQYWLDCDFFVGINPGTNSEWVDQLKDIGITNIIHVRPELVINSDASAYQAALLLYKNSNKNYKNVFFMQTKGMSYNSEQQWNTGRQHYYEAFAKDRSLHEKLLEPEDVGGSGQVSFFDWEFHRNVRDISQITDFIDTPYKNVIDLRWQVTHFVIKNEIVKYFVDNCKQDFFSKKLSDRYFFEMYFQIIVELISDKKRNSCHFWLRDNDWDPNEKDLKKTTEKNYQKAIDLWEKRKII